MTLDCNSVIAAIGRYHTFVILGHEDPDADCLCSQRVLASWLERKGKKVHLCNTGPWKRVEIAQWQAMFATRIPDIEPDTVSVIVDCSSFDRTGFESEKKPATPFIVIDHHSSGSDFGDIRCINSQSPSTTLIIQHLIETSGDKLTLEEAELLFMGFSTDSGFFRHLDELSGDSLRMVSRLVDAGVSPKKIHGMLNRGHNIDSRILLGRNLSRARQYVNNQVVISREILNDQEELGPERDSDMLYQLLLGISGIKVAAAVREQKDGSCSVGLRSVETVDVGRIAEKFGGGGHKFAAGCLIQGDSEEVIQQLVNTISLEME